MEETEKTREWIKKVLPILNIIIILGIISMATGIYLILDQISPGSKPAGKIIIAIILTAIAFDAVKGIINLTEEIRRKRVLLILINGLIDLVLITMLLATTNQMITNSGKTLTNIQKTSLNLFATIVIIRQAIIIFTKLEKEAKETMNLPKEIEKSMKIGILILILFTTLCSLI